MVTTSIAYHPRQKMGTFGLSNRIQFLKRQLATAEPSYPPSYHGKGRTFALGLTEAGCPSSHVRSLDIPTSFGKNREHKEIVHMPPVTRDAPVITREIPLKSIADVLQIERQILPYISNRITIKKDYPEKATRYSANREWTRNTCHLTQGDSTKHHYITEQVT
jgi:hypothetical protein